MPNGEATAEEAERQVQFARDAQEKRQSQTDPLEAAKSAAEKVPGAGKAVGWFGKMVPILWWLIIPPKGPVIILLCLLPIVWPLLSFLSFIGIRGFKIPMLPTKLPKTTVWEVMASILLLLLIVALIYGLVMILLCTTASGIGVRVYYYIRTGQSVSCKF